MCDMWPWWKPKKDRNFHASNFLQTTHVDVAPEILHAGSCPGGIFHFIPDQITYAYFATPTYLLSNSAARPLATQRLTQFLKDSLKALYRNMRFEYVHR